ncbi:hypothetical protein GCM10011352_30370 [Marinobacterium zhoushanense]|uniref:Uncharacterized protein n=1 Tax=Marinobacterium zhoushanense TaxID=1679163 RepID=A0ABQ1KMT2_9GAMM|nr:hypothetical protein [Marinobacterium zhoushanense]GGC02102.1 hypothetical protein GCM10011352_30370 [Marinobacterium zhoushanense]
MNVFKYLIAACLLTLTCSLGAAEGDEVPTPSADQKAAAPVQKLELPEMPPREAFEGILQRPLFASDRRPTSTEEGRAAISARELRETWRLTGIIMVGSDTKALLQERDGERHMVLSVGMPLDDSWLLEEIRADAVVMDSGEEQVRLELIEPRDRAPAEPEQSTAAEGQNGDGETRPLDQGAQEAAERLRQDIQTTKDERNE